jgi:hypothetical protein
MLRDFVQDRPVHALLTVANIGFLVYGILTFVEAASLFRRSQRSVTADGALRYHQGTLWHRRDPRRIAA